jgi:hypothetical protein
MIRFTDGEMEDRLCIGDRAAADSADQFLRFTDAEANTKEQIQKAAPTEPAAGWRRS